jgi:hypothetical protein
MESDGGMILTGENRRTRRKTCPSATLSTINPTQIDPGANPGLRGERPATSDLSHGTAPVIPTFRFKIKKLLMVKADGRYGLSYYDVTSVGRPALPVRIIMDPSGAGRICLFLRAYLMTLFLVTQDYIASRERVINHS